MNERRGDGDGTSAGGDATRTVGDEDREGLAGKGNRDGPATGEATVSFGGAELGSSLSVISRYWADVALSVGCSAAIDLEAGRRRLAPFELARVSSSSLITTGSRSDPRLVGFSSVLRVVDLTEPLMSGFTSTASGRAGRADPSAFWKKFRMLLGVLADSFFFGVALAILRSEPSSCHELLNEDKV